MTQSKGTIRHRLMIEIDEFKHQDKMFISKALSIAEEVHDKQVRKPSKADPFEKRPFISHPMRVALIILEELGFRDREYMASALLHDVVEQSNGKVTTHDLEKNFSRGLALSISILTKPAPDQDIPRKKQLQTYYERIAQAGIPTRVVKLAERLDNLREGIDVDDIEWQKAYLQETKEVFLPIAEKTDDYLYNAITEMCQQWDEALKQGSNP